VELIGSVTERTTAATDLLLAVAAFVGAALLHRGEPPTMARRIWSTALASAGLASLLGAVTHGLVMSQGLREALWQPLYLLLGITVACFVAGAIGDAAGPRRARMALGPMLLIALGFYLATRLSGGDFLVFVLFQAAALLAVLATYLWLARHGRAGAGIVAAALGVSLAAGAVQANTSLSATLIWEFDHNGLYHLVQLAGLGLLVAGLTRTLRGAPGESA
jgi:hypothetical protein